MREGNFELNGKPMSALRMAGLSFPAFSGTGRFINGRTSACHVGFGPIPPGAYYIFDRQSGGWERLIPDVFDKRSRWFALYAIDGKIDDETYCDRVKRGLFRLHYGTVSAGCITVKDFMDYEHLRMMLKETEPVAVPGSDLEAYGRLVVR